MSEKIILLNGFIFKAKRLSVRKWFDLKKKSIGSDGLVSELLLYENLLKEVVISPKMEVDNFDRVGDLEWLMNELITYQIEKTEEQKEKTFKQNFDEQLLELSKEMLEQVKKMNESKVK